MVVEEKVALIRKLGEQYITALETVARIEGHLRDVVSTPLETGESAEAKAEHRAKRKEIADKVLAEKTQANQPAEAAPVAPVAKIEQLSPPVKPEATKPPKAAKAPKAEAKVEPTEIVQPAKADAAPAGDPFAPAKTEAVVLQPTVPVLRSKMTEVMKKFSLEVAITILKNFGGATAKMVEEVPEAKRQAYLDALVAKLQEKK